MLGLYVSAHPLDGADHILRKAAPKSIGAVLANPPREGELVISGMISSLERRVNKKGETWAIAVIEDLDASIEVLFFPKSYAVLSADLIEDSAVVVKGRVNWREDKMAVFGSDLAPLDVSSAKPGAGEPPLVLEMSAVGVEYNTVVELRSTLRAHRGITPVQIIVCHEQRRTTLAVDDYPVTVTSALLGELRSVPGVRVAS
jgi:DNA polymerase-3 subunit alpha